MSQLSALRNLTCRGPWHAAAAASVPEPTLTGKQGRQGAPSGERAGLGADQDTAAISQGYLADVGADVRTAARTFHSGGENGVLMRPLT